MLKEVRHAPQYAQTRARAYKALKIVEYLIFRRLYLEMNKFEVSNGDKDFQNGAFCESMKLQNQIETMCVNLISVFHRGSGCTATHTAIHKKVIVSWNSVN